MNRKRFKSPKRVTVKPKSGPGGGDELATLHDAVEFLKFTEKTIRKKAKTGELPGRLVFGEWRFPWSALREVAGV